MKHIYKENAVPGNSSRERVLLRLLLNEPEPSKSVPAKFYDTTDDMFTVPCPDNCLSGYLDVVLPDGRKCSVQIPQGIKTGDTINFFVNR